MTEERKTEEKKEDLSRCRICDNYLRRLEGFACPRCKRHPICKSHRVPGRKECASCVFDMKARELQGLAELQRSLQGAVRFFQFLFFAFVLLFAASRVKLPEELDFFDFLQSEGIKDALPYIGAAVALGLVIFYLMLLSQRSKVGKAREELKKLEHRRLVARTS